MPEVVGQYSQRVSAGLPMLFNRPGVSRRLARSGTTYVVIGELADVLPRDAILGGELGLLAGGKLVVI